MAALVGIIVAGTAGYIAVLILVGVGTALFTFTQGLEVVVEGHVQEVLGRRRMEREITGMSGSEAKLAQAGADRVVNPQGFGGAASPPSFSSPTWPSSSMS